MHRNAVVHQLLYDLSVNGGRGDHHVADITAYYKVGIIPADDRYAPELPLSVIAEINALYVVGIYIACGNVYQGLLRIRPVCDYEERCRLRTEYAYLSRQHYPFPYVLHHEGQQQIETVGQDKYGS